MPGTFATNERWLRDMFEECEAQASSQSATDPGTALFSLVSARIPGLMFVMPPNVDPQGMPHRIPAFYRWLYGWYLKGTD